MKYVYLCEDTPEGIFTAVYNAYEDRHGIDCTEVKIRSGCFNQEFFAEYISVDTDYEKAVKVARTIQKKISMQAYDFIMKSAISYKPEKADAIYRFIAAGLKMGACVLEHLTAPYMQTLFALERHTDNEIMHLRGFLRFEELENGILFARTNPKNAILPYLAEHFADRFSGEEWMIADTVHETVVIHKKNKGYIHAAMSEINFDELSLQFSAEEHMIKELWNRFVDTIAIEERKNENLQRQMLPLRFRKYMKEFSRE